MPKPALQIKLEKEDRRDLDLIKKSMTNHPWRVTYRSIVQMLIANEAQKVKVRK